MILLLDVQVLYIVLNGTSRAGESVQPPVSREPEKCPVLHADFPKRKDDAKIELDAGFAPQRDRDPSLEMLTDVARQEAESAVTIAARSKTASEACAQAYAELKTLGQDRAFFGLYQERLQLTNENAALEGKILNLQTSYDFALLEKKLLAKNQ